MGLQRNVPRRSWRSVPLALPVFSLVNPFWENLSNLPVTCHRFEGRITTETSKAFPRPFPKTFVLSRGVQPFRRLQRRQSFFSLPIAAR